ncbi:DUF4126 domain-containing protein [Dyella koreensis]|uniref:DUF4126 domain-containing protein n=1 Tax=Dyella koreensis TaxID=311235 RepID=A0ABW8K9M4_9GAMM
MDTLSNVALAGGLAWASGIRLYATVFVAGLLGRLGVVHLPSGLDILTDNWMLGVSGVLMVGEFLADKVPAFDSIWDAIHTFIRIPAGTLLAWGVFKDSTPAMQTAAALLGGALVSGTHLAKSGSRALINTSPEPFSNWGASVGEDISWMGILYLMWQHPLVLLIALGIFIVLLLWLLPKILRGLRALWRTVQRFRGALGGDTTEDRLPPPQSLR